MTRYARLKQELTLFNKRVIIPANEPYTITVPKGTIVQIDYWSSEYKLVTVEPYRAACKKANLEFLDEGS